MAGEMAGDESGPRSGSSTSRSPAGPARLPTILSEKARRTRCLPIWRLCAQASMPEVRVSLAMARLRAALGAICRFQARVRALRWPLEPGGRGNDLCRARTSTAWAEYNQGFVQHPALIAQFELTGARLADMTDADAGGVRRTGNPPTRVAGRSRRRSCPTPTVCGSVAAAGHGVSTRPSCRRAAAVLRSGDGTKRDGPRLESIDPEIACRRRRRPGRRVCAAKC